MNQHSSCAAGYSSPLGLDEDLVAAARKLYDLQKQDLRDIVQTLAGLPVSSDEADRLARLVHNIAGTASYFGESALGREASAIELRLNASRSDEERQIHCRSLARVINQATC